MKKVAIVGVEGSGKTVMLAGLGDLYTYPDDEGYFLAPKNFGTAAYVAEKVEGMRKGKWPAATAGDEMQGLDWTLERKEPGARRPPEKICEVSFLDFAGEVYRTAFGIGAGDPSLAEQAEELKRYVSEADELIVLINLRDVIANGLGDTRVQEAMWITNAILDAALSEHAGRKVPRAAIVLSQADSYAETIKACDGAIGVLRKHLPHVANRYDWLDVFSASAVDKTKLDDDGHMVPAADFTSKGLLPIMTWIRDGVAEDGGRGATALPGSDLTGGSRLSQPSEPIRANQSDDLHKKVQLWEGGPYWAETNIGAEKPWESGYYFWWGDTIGYKWESVGYKWEDGVWVASDGSSSNFSFFDKIPTYGKNISTLQREGWVMKQKRGWFTTSYALAREHDAAHVKWGGKWRMPTDKEFQDLFEKCFWNWTQMNGIEGYVVCGRGEYASASIFLPAAGGGFQTSHNFLGSHGVYWSSVPYACYGGSGGLDFNLSHHYMCSCSRYLGSSVRPVQGFAE